MKYEPAGPPRFDHQKVGLKKFLDTHGVTALLFDPGTGKTATVLDYIGILALKSPRREARVLVICPLAAVDTWVMQCETFMTKQVNFWAEAVGGSIAERGQALASRGGNPTLATPSRGPRDSWQGPRAAGWNRAYFHLMRGTPGDPEPVACEGPDGLGNVRPRVVLEIVNIDSFAQRTRVCRRHWLGKCETCKAKTMTLADAMLDAVRRFGPDLVVVDESHKIKGATSNASRLLGRIGDIVPRRAILTGTVMPAGPLDAFGQWRFLEPYAFGDRLPDGSMRRSTFGSFKSRYAIEGGWMGQEIKGYQNLDEMQAIMARNAVVARKDDCLDLPSTMTVTVPVNLSEAEKQSYRDMVDDLVVKYVDGDATATNRLTQMMRLRQITSGYLPLDGGATKEIGQSKANTIRSLVHDTLTGEKRIVIFALFTHEIELLTRALRQKGTEVMTISGGTSVAERLHMRKRFGSNDRARMVMIAQIKTMSLAVNELVTANHAIFASLSWQRDDLIQAQDRLNRMGQTRKVTFWYCLAPGTVDEVIMQSHREGTNLENAMLTHIQQVHAGADSTRFKVAQLAQGNDMAEMAVRDALGFAGF